MFKLIILALTLTACGFQKTDQAIADRINSQQVTDTIEAAKKSAEASKAPAPEDTKITRPKVADQTTGEPTPARAYASIKNCRATENWGSIEMKVASGSDQPDVYEITLTLEGYENPIKISKAETLPRDGLWWDMDRAVVDFLNGDNFPSQGNHYRLLKNSGETLSYDFEAMADGTGVRRHWEFATISCD